MQELWKPIPGFSLYEASTLGNLRSINYKRTGKVRTLKPAMSSDGYLKTMLKEDSGKYRSWTVHKFVALAFLPPRPEGMQINHIDGVKTNNSIDNLEWVTPSENVLHAFRIGLELPSMGEKNGNSKLTEDQVRLARKMKRENGRFWGRNELAKDFGITEKHLQEIVNNPNLWPGV